LAAGGKERAEPLVGDGEVVKTARRCAPRRATLVARHHSLLPGLHEEAIFPRLEILFERDTIGADGHVFRPEGDLLVAFHTRLSSRQASEGTDLKLALLEGETLRESVLRTMASVPMGATLTSRTPIIPTDSCGKQSTWWVRLVI